MSNVPDLQPIAADTGRLLPSLTNAVWTSDASTSYELNTKCQDFITRYLGRSLITPDDPHMIQVNRKLLTLAFTVSFHDVNPVAVDKIHAILSIMGVSLANI